MSPIGGYVFNFIVPSNYFNHEEEEKSLAENPPVDVTEQLNCSASQADLVELRREFAKVHESVSDVWHSAALQDIRFMRALGDIEARFEAQLAYAAQRNVCVASDVAHELDGTALAREAELQKRIVVLEQSLAREAGLQKRIAMLEQSLARLRYQAKIAVICLLLLIGLVVARLAFGR